MTVPPFIKSCAVKVLLPGALLAAAIIRPCFLSIGYVLFALLSAIVPPIRKNIALPKVVGTFVTITFLFCLAVALGIGSYQISEQVVHKNDRTYICNRSDTTLFRSIGLVRFHPTGTFESTRAFLPEIIATATALLTFVIVMLLSHRDEQLDVVGDVVTVRSESGREQRRQRKMAAIMWSAIGNSLRRLTNFVIFLFTAYVGIVKPSVSNSVYFGAFLFISTWWATYTPLRHGVYNKIKKFLIFYSAIHFLVLYTYQIPIVHNSWLPTGSFLSRLFGLTVLMDSSCPDWWKFPFVAPDFNDDDLIMKWPLYANPIVVLVFYYLTVSQYKFTKNGSRQYIDDNDYGSSVHEELLSNASSSNEDEQGRARSRSPVRNGEGQNSIPLRKVTSQVVDRNKLSNIFNKQESAASKGMIACMTFVIFHSYSIALTAMMTWALLYHSIFGLILLILTCILWIFRDTRRSSFTMAPLILLYIEFLLCLQYILSFDIHDEIGDPDWMDFVGIKWSTIPVNALIILCVQTLLSLPVFLLLRLARREKYYESLSDFERQRRINSYGTFGASKTGAGGVAVAKDRRVESLLHLWNIYRVDPPEAPSRKDAPARLLSWVDPYKCGAHKAALEIGLSTQRAYEKWQPKSKTFRTRYKICTDPPIDDVRKVATNLRRISGNDRVLFHYNGHGVPKPTDNGEIWVFNKSFTQYIPLSIFDLQGWLDYPTIYIWETHSAETILHNYRRFGEDQKISWQSRFDRWQEEQRNLPPISSKMTDADQAEALGFPEKYPRYNDCIHLAACSAGQWLPMSNPHLPADLFTSCLTTPIRTSLAFHLSHSEHRNEYPENILDMIPGNLAERRTVLGELNWIFTAITDTIAFTSINRDSFQKLFRQDLLLATLFRSFLLAQRVMSKFDVLPVSQPPLKDTSRHDLWRCWDQTMDMVLDYCRELMYVKETERALFCGRDVINRSNVFPFLVLIDYEHVLTFNETHQYNTFFTEQLQAFELWLDYGVDEGTPPLQLPMVLQVLLSQAHRVRALRLLARFLDFGRWAIGYSLAVGIFPYVLKLLQSNISDLKISLAFIWAKILAVDPSCQMELFNECIDESATQNQSPQQPQQQQSVALKQSSMFANHPPPPQLAMDKRALQINTQTGGRFQNNQNQALDLQLQYAQQQAHQRQMDPSGGQHSPNPQPRQPQQQQRQPQGIMKPTNPQAPEKKTMLRFQYFLQLLGDPDIKPKQKTVAAFVLAQLTSNNFRLAQKELTSKGYMGICTELMVDDTARSVKLLKLWILIGLGRLWSDYDVARWQGIRLMAHDKMILELSDDSAEVRAAAVFALGSLLRNSSRSNEHASAVEENLADELCAQCVFDSSVLVREELIVALQWFVFDFEKRFVKFLLDLSNQIKFKLPRKRNFSENENEQGLDIAAEMPSNRRHHREPPVNEFMQPSVIRKKMSTSVFTTAVEETVHEDDTGNVYAVGHDEGHHVERESEDFEYRERAKAQIKHLEAKTFNEAVARTWLSLLRLSLDPIERVARMAQKIVHRVEAGIPEMQANIDNTMAHLNRKMIARKTSRATVEMPRRPVGPSEEVSNLAERIKRNLEVEKETGASSQGIDFTELEIQRQKEQPKRKGQIKKLQDESKVKFQVGSPGDVTQHQRNALSPGSSFTSETQSSELFSKDEESDEENDEDRSATEERDVATTASGKTVKGALRKAEFMDAATMEFTPRRTKAVPGDFAVKEESKTLRTVIENPIVSTQFVAWCSKVFVEPILHVITLDEEKPEDWEHEDEDEFMPEQFREKIKEIQKQDRKLHEEKRARDKKEGKKERSQEDVVVTTTTISDWAIHAMEGMVQSAEVEGRNFQNCKYDECLWNVKLTHPARSLITSKLRRCMYASDGQMMTIIRQDTDTRYFRRFDLTASNPFCPSYVSQLILINDMSREMVIACSSNGIVRIWDPYFLGWCDDYEKPPELVSASFPLETQMKLSDETNKCLFDWNQQNGKLLCTGTRSVRIWDAHCEKVCQDVMYSPGSKQQAGLGAKLDKHSLPTAMSGNLDEEGNMVAVGYGDGRVDYFDMRMANPKAARCTLAPANMGNQFDVRPPGIMHLRVNRKGFGTEMFAGSQDGSIYKLQLRMFKEASPSIVTPWEPGQHSFMFVHEDSRILASASNGEIAIYDVARNKKMAFIEPPMEPNVIRRDKSSSTFGLFSSQRKLSAAQLSAKMTTGDKKPSVPKVISLTMHQMRLLTVAGYSDNTVCVYGSPKPGLTGHYDNTQGAENTKASDN